MNRSEIMTAIRRHQAEIQAEGITALYLFGSRARGDADDLSDVDVLVDYDRAIKGHFSLFEIIAVKHMLEDELGLPVDIIPRADLGRIRAAAEQDAVRVF
ncbi:MAG: DNA polymerase III subunit beta [Rhizobiales bacterium]|nr:DNA polymerase III subunit beta [Hyphomicrobiales bacterium]